MTKRVLVLLSVALLAACGGGPSHPAARTTSVKALFFGDSITEGCCTDHTGDPTMVTATAKALGWTADVQGSGGTGYTSAGPAQLHRVPYTQRIDRVLAQAGPVDVVVLEGGGNDDSTTIATFQAAVHEVFAAVAQAEPHAAVVVLGPYAPPADGTAAYAQKRATLKAEASAHGWPFIDPIGEAWLTDPAQVGSDGFHPNTAGHATLAQHLESDLRRDLPQSLLAAT